MKTKYTTKNGRHTNIVKTGGLPATANYREAVTNEQVYAVMDANMIGILMYIARVNKQWMVWYSKGGFWTGYGTTAHKAIEGAITDAWLYA